MNFFYNDYRSGYEEVKSYYPVWYPQIKEMNANFYLSGSFLDRMALDMERTANNRFLMEMEETVIDRLLNYFGIVGPKGMEEKRNLLVALYSGNGKVSASQIIDWVRIFWGENVGADVKFTDQLKVTIHLQTVDEAVHANFYDFLKRKIPAHLSVISEYAAKHKKRTKVYATQTAFSHVRLSFPTIPKDSYITFSVNLKIAITTLHSIAITAAAHR